MKRTALSILIISIQASGIAQKVDENPDSTNTTRAVGKYSYLQPRSQITDLQKVVSKTAELQTDGSYIVHFMLYTFNFSREQLDSIQITDDMSVTFPSAGKYEICGVKASGKLIVNELYNGNSQTGLLADGSVLPAMQKDSIEICVIFFPKGFYGPLKNVAKQIIRSGNEIVTTISNDPTSGDGLAVRSPTKFIIPEIDIFIPSGFSPNQDGINDYFVIVHPPNTLITFEVFNRSGTPLYKAIDYQNQWNGKANLINNSPGNNLADGTYYYVVTATDKTTGAIRKLAGFIALKR